MRKITGTLLALVVLHSVVTAQTKGSVQKSSFAVHFVFNDFSTAAKVRANNLGIVLKNREFGKLKEMAPGLAFNYMKGMSRNFDLSATLAGTFVDYPIPNKPAFGRDLLLLEGDVSVRGKMVSNDYFLQPYLSAGLGVSKYKGYYAAFMPVGAGMQLNIFDESFLLINAQYRVPVSEQAAYHFFYSIGFAGIIGKKGE